MKRFLIALALTCVFSTSVLAGDVPTVGAPVPGQSGTTKETTANPGDRPTGGDADQLSSDALSVALSVLSFLIR